MKNTIDLEITVPGQTRYLGMVGKIGEDMALELDPFSGDRETFAQQMNLVLTEAMVNAIKHANDADPHKDVHVRITVSDQELTIRVYDSGAGFDLGNVQPPCFNASALDEKGRGIFIIRSLMDTVRYRKAKGGYVLEMKKALS